MRFIEQSDVLKSVLTAAGVAAAEQLDIVDGQLLIDGVPHALVPSEFAAKIAPASPAGTFSTPKPRRKAPKAT